ncbi:hypothetical protein H0H87_011748 [Tephrocybe sp. NHM501043]|nr:hypothetical protein H0H87_011748 [Tephrocybe sp. NHM501043]
MQEVSRQATLHLLGSPAAPSPVVFTLHKELGVPSASHYPLEYVTRRNLMQRFPNMHPVSTLVSRPIPLPILKSGGASTVDSPTRTTPPHFTPVIRPLPLPKPKLKTGEKKPPAVAPTPVAIQSPVHHTNDTRATAGDEHPIGNAKVKTDTKRKRSEEKDDIPNTKLRRIAYDDALQIHQQEKGIQFSVSRTPEAQQRVRSTHLDSEPLHIRKDSRPASRVQVIGWKNTIDTRNYLLSTGKLDVEDEEKLEEVLIKLDEAVLTRDLLKEVPHGPQLVAAVKKVIKGIDGMQYRRRVTEKAAKVYRLWKKLGFL